MLSMFCQNRLIGFFFCVALTLVIPFHSLIATHPESTPSIISLRERIDADLKSIHYLKYRWVIHPTSSSSSTSFNSPSSSELNSTQILDVAVVGGGMGGLAAGFGLHREGLCKVKIFDQNEPGKEGPWETTARMKYLRSDKTSLGPAMGIPSLTFQAWYTAKYGEEAWDQLNLVPTADWASYLRWYRHVLKLPLQNGMKLLDIRPAVGCLELLFDRDGAIELVYAYKVVLATGRDGFGGGELPEYADQLPKDRYAHTNEQIDFKTLSDKIVVIIGAGAAAFDAAALALDNGASDVHMLVRRRHIPLVNKFAKLGSPGMLRGFYFLSDEQRLELFGDAFSSGIPPPKTAVARVCGHKNLHFHMGVHVEGVAVDHDRVLFRTDKEDISADFVIFGTGFGVNGLECPELHRWIDSVLLWKDRFQHPLLVKYPKLGRFPYLGAHFQFLENKPGVAPELRNIYCFNYGAFFSHGLISGDIPGISIGATRLAEGIVEDFFVEGYERYLLSVHSYETPVFDPACYDLFEIK